MSALDPSMVVELGEWYPSRNQQIGAKFLQLTLTGQGSVANPITASALGFTKLLQATAAVASDNSAIIEASPSADQSMLLLKAAGTNAPADYTAVVQLVVYGE